jgi:DNA topoisomerase-2
MEILRVKDFINNEFKQFSLYDCVRSIPSVCDGLKPSQRKSIYGFLDRGENAPEIQVERIAAHIAAVSVYHHGTASLETTVIGMAQNYPGSNNMNLFEPSGQFGSRLSPESASPRYVFTKFSENFRKLFRKEDDIILKYQEEDGVRIEPKYYIPILPTILINGAQGVGTGYACKILGYNPIDIKNAVISILSGKKIKPLIPWYRGFKGKIYRNGNQTIIEGQIEIVNGTTIKVTELPIGTFLNDFKNNLYKLEDNGFIKSFEDLSTENGFEFILNVPRSTTALSEDIIKQKLKLISRETENFTLWDTNGKIREYSSPEEIIEDFVKWRLERYEERRQALIKKNSDELEWLNNKLRFILYYLKNSKEFSNKNKKEMIDILEQEKFIDIDKLIRIPIYSLTKDEIESLKKEIADIELLIKKLKSTTAKDMYINELEEFKNE